MTTFDQAYVELYHLTHGGAYPSIAEIKQTFGTVEPTTWFNPWAQLPGHRFNAFGLDPWVDPRAWQQSMEGQTRTLETSYEGDSVPPWVETINGRFYQVTIYGPDHPEWQWHPATQQFARTLVPHPFKPGLWVGAPAGYAATFSAVAGGGDFFDQLNDALTGYGPLIIAGIGAGVVASAAIAAETAAFEAAVAVETGTFMPSESFLDPWDLLADSTVIYQPLTEPAFLPLPEAVPFPQFEWPSVTPQTVSRAATLAQRLMADKPQPRAPHTRARVAPVSVPGISPEPMGELAPATWWWIPGIIALVVFSA